MDDVELDSQPTKIRKMTKSLARHAEQGLIHQLRQDLNTKHSKAAYCCGGSIPIIQIPNDSERELHQRLTLLPVKLYFQHPNDPDSFTRIRFPETSNDAESRFDALLRACKSLHPEFDSAEGAVCLKPGEFSLEFHPADYGITDDISEIMVPGIKSLLQHHRFGVRAELHMLEIHSNQVKSKPSKPSEQSQDGFEEHFGYLIVCLAWNFQGGSTVISKGPYTIEFDWSTSSGSTIQWAAFYKDDDCHYHPCPVSSGHCVSVTYKLFLAERTGGPMKALSASSSSAFPLYQQIYDALAYPKFMEGGGVFGYYFDCQNYSDTDQALFPNSLKDSDLAMFSLFRSLGLETTVRQVYAPEEFRKLDEMKYRHDRDYGSDLDDESPQPCLDSHQRLFREKYQNFEEWMKDNGDHLARVGADCSFVQLTMPDERETLYNIEWEEFVQYELTEEERFFQEVRDVTWLNVSNEKGWKLTRVILERRPTTKYPSISLRRFHTHGAIFAKVPKRGERILEP